MGECERNPPAAEPERWTVAVEVVRRTVTRRLALHDAEDAVGQALLELMRYRRRAEDIDSWQGLCATVARRVSARSGRPPAFQPFGDLDPADDHESEPAIAAWFRGSFLPRLARRLTGRQHDVLQRLLRGETIAGIARNLGTTPKSVRESLREILKKGRELAKSPPPPNHLEATEHLIQGKDSTMKPWVVSVFSMLLAAVILTSAGTSDSCSGRVEFGELVCTGSCDAPSAECKGRIASAGYEFCDCDDNESGCCHIVLNGTEPDTQGDCPTCPLPNTCNLEETEEDEWQAGCFQPIE